MLKTPFPASKSFNIGFSASCSSCSTFDLVWLTTSSYLLFANSCCISLVSSDSILFFIFLFAIFKWLHSSLSSFKSGSSESELSSLLEIELFIWFILIWLIRTSIIIRAAIIRTAVIRTPVIRTRSLRLTWTKFLRTLHLRLSYNFRSLFFYFLFYALLAY